MRPRPTLLPLLLLPCIAVLAACGGGGGAGDDAGPPSDTWHGHDTVTPPPSFDPAEYRDPPAEYRPWVRWWWPGDDVADDELRREVTLLAAAGFGGAEIQPFEAALDPEADAATLARRRNVPSAAHTAHLRTALDAAAAHGLRIDLTFGSGWPTGGVHVAPADSMTTLVWSEHVVEGPASWSVDALAPTKPPFYHAAELSAGFGERLARWLPNHASLVAVVAAEETGGRRSPVLFDLDDTVRLDRDSVTVLTDQVAADGSLTWEAPAGTWRVVAFFAVPDGQYVQLAALPDPETAFVVDHLDARAVTDSLAALVPDALADHFGGALRGLFVDSFELKTERIFTDDFLAEFERRRGYDLVPFLPVVLVPGADDYIFEAGRVPRAPEFAYGADDDDVRADYRATVSELFVERFVQTVATWAGQRDMLLRLQAYGLDVDVMHAAGSADIAEAEQLYAGGSDLFVKLVASAAWTHARARDASGPLVSAESFVWILRDHMGTPLKWKAAADKLFTAGVNHVVFHGFPYDVDPDGDEYGLYGWAPFSSRHGGATTYADTFGERSAFWAFLPTLNRYIARCQLLLRQGRPAVDLLVVYPWDGFPTSLALEEDFVEPLLGGWLPEAEPLSREVPFADLGALFGPPQTDPRVAWLKALAPRLAALEDRGVTWAWVSLERLDSAWGDARHAGVGALSARAFARFELPPRAAAAVAAFDPVVRTGALLVDLGEGPADDPSLPDELVPAVSFARPSPVRTIRRTWDGLDRIVFFRNPGGAPQRAEVTLAGGCPDGRWLDPWTGRVTRAEHAADVGLSVDLPGYGSIALLCRAEDAPLDEPVPPLGDAEPVALPPVSLVVAAADAAGTEFTAAKGAAPLGDWRELEPLRHARGPAVYRFGFTVDGAVPAAALTVGHVFGAATVTLDGAAVGDLLVPPFTLRLPAPLAPGEHTVEVTLVPPLRNHLVGLAATGDERYRQFADGEDTLVAAGLEGPVTVTCAPPGQCTPTIP